ncbi:MAG: MAPEG family protein [Bdellovibrionota bacterium]
MTKYLVLPMFSMVLLTVGVMVAMLRARIQAIKSGQVKLNHFKVFAGGQPTEAMLKAAQHFDNLFETPVLFYVACLAAMQLQVGGIAIHLFAWAFVVSRLAHAYIHIGSNDVRTRMRIFMLSCTCIFSMWIILLIQIVRSN